MRVRATGSPRAHPPEVVGHGRRSPRFRNPLIGALRGTQHVVKRAAISRTRHRLQPFSTKGARCGADARFFSSWTAAVWSQATGRGFESPCRQAQAGSGGRCAKDRAQGLLAEGKKINLAVGAQWHSKKKKRRAGSELGRGFEVRPSIGRRSSGGRSDRIKLGSPRPTSSQPSQYGPSIHPRSGSFAAGG